MARCSLEGHQLGLYVLAVGADEAVFAGHPQPGSAPSGDEAVEAQITDINGAAVGEGRNDSATRGSGATIESRWVGDNPLRPSGAACRFRFNGIGIAGQEIAAAIGDGDGFGQIELED